MTITIDKDNNLQALEQLSLSRPHSCDSTAPFNSIVSTACALISSSVGWIIITPSLFGAGMSRRMKQANHTEVARDLYGQSNEVRQLKKFSSSVPYPRLFDSERHKVSLLVLSNTGLQSKRGQLCYV